MSAKEKIRIITSTESLPLPLQLLAPAPKEDLEAGMVDVAVDNQDGFFEKAGVLAFRWTDWLVRQISN